MKQRIKCTTHPHVLVPGNNNQDNTKRCGNKDDDDDNDDADNEGDKDILTYPPTHDST